MHGSHLIKSNAWLAGILFLVAGLISFSQVQAHPSAEPTVITENTEKLNLAMIAEYLEDTQGVLRVEELEKPEYSRQFKPVDLAALNSGISQAVIWLRFDLKYISYVGEESGEWLIEVAYPALDLVTLYLMDFDGVYHEYNSGDKYPFDIRAVAHPSFIFPIEMYNGDVTHFYLRVETTGSMQIPVKLWSPIAYLEQSNRADTLYGAIYGILLVMLFYNLMLFIRIREQSYFYYVLYIGGFLLYLLSINGTGLAHLWPDYPMINSGAPFFMSITGVSGVLFTQSFLKLAEKSAVINRFYTAMLMAGLLIVPFTLITHNGLASKLVMIQVLPTLPVMMLTGLYFWLAKGDRSARFFFLAFATFIASAGVYSLMLMGFLPSNALTRNIIPIGLSFEVTLLSLALASRIRGVRENKVVVEQQAKQELEKSNQRLLEAGRLKDEFLSAASRELKKPMSELKNALELIDPNGQQDALLEARDSAHEMSEVISNLLSLSEIQSGSVTVKRSPFNVRRQLNILEDQFKPACEKKGLSIETSVHNMPETLYGDAQKLFKALSLVLENAVKFTEEGGVTVIATTRPHEQSGKIRLQVCIDDTGIGIEESAGRDVFQPFQKVNGSAKGHSGGQGLGLTICRQLMHIMGGTVSFNNRPDQGTRFELSVTCLVELH
ncbi:sensor histidine kinase [Endozoicomonas arenosclerae]|uniref:sensor histidine kinase n=1 Tax=Endozoicomonas arenosclerae TaxID=1633495 RepID=UPI0007824BB8|nr:sensor histidine kinase [Endozoicomonas arenosclerae]